MSPIDEILNTEFSVFFMSGAFCSLTLYLFEFLAGKVSILLSILERFGRVSLYLYVFHYLLVFTLARKLNVIGKVNPLVTVCLIPFLTLTICAVSTLTAKALDHLKRIVRLGKNPG